MVLDDDISEKSKQVLEINKLNSECYDLKEELYYLKNDSTLTEFSKTAIQSKLFIFSRAIVRSPIFIENYNNLAPTLLTPFFKTYFKQNFNV